MTSDQELERLLGLAQSGDRKALVGLLEACAPKVRARIEPKIGAALRSSLDVDDVMQVTFLEAVMLSPVSARAVPRASSLGSPVWRRTT